MDYCVFHVYFTYIQYKYFIFICIYASHKCTLYVAYICVYIYTFSDWIIRTTIWSSIIIPSCIRGNRGIGGLSTCLGSLSSKGQNQDKHPAGQLQQHPLHSYTTVSKCVLTFTSSKRKTIEERASGATGSECMEL